MGRVLSSAAPLTMKSNNGADMTKAFRMLKDSKINSAAKAGTTVYSCKGWDYGCANDDSRATGIEHTSVTLDPEGDYPFFTVPKSDLKPLT